MVQPSPPLLVADSLRVRGSIGAGFWRVPTRGDALEAVGLALLLVAVWFLVFSGANFLTSCHRFRFRIHLPGEERLPFVPASVLVYQSLHGLFVMAPFVLGRKDLRRIAATLVAVILVAGVGFLLVPADLAFPPAGDVGRWESMVRHSKEIALPHNLVPSLHVALAVSCVGVYAPRAAGPGKALLWGWASAIACSTLLFHQHHLLDVVVGWTLGRVAVRLLYERRFRPGAERCPSPSRDHSV